MLNYLEIKEDKNYHGKLYTSYAYFLSFHKQDNFTILFIVSTFFSTYKTKQQQQKKH